MGSRACGINVISKVSAIPYDTDISELRPLPTRTWLPAIKYSLV